MISAAALAVSSANRWLLAGSLAALVVLIGCVFARRAGRRQSLQRTRIRRRIRVGRSAPQESTSRGTRRRAGALVALGPAVGFLVAPSSDDLAVVIAVGAIGLALVGVSIERARDANRVALLATCGAAAIAVAAGARFGPTGVELLDLVGAFVFIVAVTKSVDGLGNADSLAPGMGLLAAAGLFAIAAFAHQESLASVLVGLAAACGAFLAFNLRPASLFAGRGGRLTIGFSLAVGALAVEPVPGATRALVTPMIILALFLLDAFTVTLYRLRRRRSLIDHRGDHLVHRLAAIGWSTSEAVGFLIALQAIVAAVAVFAARAVMPLWLAGSITVSVLMLVGLEVRRARLEHEHPEGFGARVRVVLGLIVIGLVVAVVPLALTARDTVDLMQQGRSAASRGLAAARDGDTLIAQVQFRRAALIFGQARDKLESPALAGGLAVPFVASNLSAARALANIGADLSSAGESLTVAVKPDALEVVDGQLPLDEVQKVTPKLLEGAAALSKSLAELNDVRDDPYLASPVRDAVDKIHAQLARADREATRAAAAAQLAPAIFGGDGPRTYLLVVQNNAESRATGGFIGNYGLITAQNGKLDVGDLLRTNSWNQVTRAQESVTVSAPADYLRRYGQFRPGTTLQNINMSPDFPSVAQALMSVAPQAGQPNVDGVMAVDPAGLAALLELTGPVNVAGWDTPITAGNVVNVTLRDAYARFARTPERADFLGDVAQVAVDQATSGRLGKPAQIAKVLGKAAHSGHLILAFARPEEQRLAQQLGVAEKMRPVHSDAIAVTSSNAAGNKIDYYLRRAVDYRVMLTPDSSVDTAFARASLSVELDNTAPDAGLPEGVIGPFDRRFVAGENRTFLSLYSPLEFRAVGVDGKATGVSPGRERGRNVYSRFTDVFSKTKQTTTVQLAGKIALRDGWYTVDVRHQPTLNPDRVNISVDVPEGWRIDKAPHMTRPFSRRANVNTSLDRTSTYRVHIVRDPGTWSLWDRLEAGA